MNNQKRKTWLLQYIQQSIWNPTSISYKNSQTDSRRILSWYDKKYLRATMFIINVDENLDVFPLKLREIFCYFVTCRKIIKSKKYIKINILHTKE